ncbi:MAG: carboxynorspermidine decarboxylase [Bacteroidales bacterium]
MGLLNLFPFGLGKENTKGKSSIQNPIPFTCLQYLPSPAYVLDQSLLENNLQIIKNVANKAEVEIVLSLKGFSMWSAFPILNAANFYKATASSLWEARLAMEEMGSPAYTYAVAYTPEEIEEISAMSSHLTFNSMNQYQSFATRAKQVNENISFGLRVNLEFSEVETDLYNPCAPGSRLGILLEDLPPKEELSSDIEGFHCHALCESSAEDTLEMIKAFEDKFKDYLPNLKWVNFGGGHLMTRKGYSLDVLVQALKNFKKRWPHLQIILEPGSAFAWETGYLLCTIEDIVQNGNIKTAIINASFTAHMPDCLEMPYKPQIIGALDASLPYQPNEYSFRYRIGGNSCLSGDYMGDWLFDHELQIGERLLFNDMIHYTMVKTCTFNGVKHPSICIIKNGNILFRRNFNYSDYKSRLS